METCIHCGRMTDWNHKTNKPYSQCRHCKALCSSVHKKWLNKVRQQGLCYCGQPTRPHKKLCKKCADYKNSIARSYRQNMEALGWKYDYKTQSWK